MRDFHIPLFPGGLYHIFNRANGDERLFREEQNYFYFLQKYRQHISPIAQTLAWCLLPNHFHFLVRMKPSETVRKRFEEKKERKPEDDKLPDFLMEQFSNWQNSYAKAVNKVYLRKGSLFMDYMRRVQIETHEQMSNTVFYIHKNPVHHGFANTIGKWPHTSYREYISGRFSLVDSTEVVDLFRTTESFVKFHQQSIVRK